MTRQNLLKLKKEIEATLNVLDSELLTIRPTLKLLVPKNSVKEKSALLGHKDTLLFVQTLMDKIFYLKPEPEEDEANLKYFKEQITKSIVLIDETIRNVKSLHPSIGIPDTTEEQFSRLVGREEMFVHFKNMLSEFEL